jgi:hypothetical protein
MKRKNGIFRRLCFLTFCLFTFSSAIGNTASPRSQIELNQQYVQARTTPSDINEHVIILRFLAKECSSVVEMGMRTMVSSWGILKGLSENPSPSCSYVGIDINVPPLDILTSAKQLAENHGISFTFCQANDMNIDIEPAELLFIDTLHTYCHLTYELEKFSPKISKYIAMHDTSSPWGTRDEDSYRGNFSEYPSEYNRVKRGLWPAVEDFLLRHPEWALYDRSFNNHGFTILKRVTH